MHLLGGILILAIVYVYFGAVVLLIILAECGDYSCLFGSDGIEMWPG